MPQMSAPMRRAASRVQGRGQEKITPQAAARTRAKTARQQLAEAQAALRGPDQIPVPDADDASVRGVLQ